MGGSLTFPHPDAFCVKFYTFSELIHLMASDKINLAQHYKIAFWMSVMNYDSKGLLRITKW